MNWRPDEMNETTFSGNGRVNVSDLYPADFVASRQLDDPLVAAEIAGLADEGLLLGVDFDDPEIMGAWLKNLINKIKDRVKARKIGVSVSTDTGVAQVGPGGVSYTDTSTLPVSPVAPSAGMAEMFKSPLVIAAGVGILAILLLKKK